MFLLNLWSDCQSLVTKPEANLKIRMNLHKVECQSPSLSPSTQVFTWKLMFFQRRLTIYLEFHLTLLVRSVSFTWFLGLPLLHKIKILQWLTRAGFLSIITIKNLFIGLCPWKTFKVVLLNAIWSFKKIHRRKNDLRLSWMNGNVRLRFEEFRIEINPFIPNAPFLTLSLPRKVFWCFHGIETGCHCVKGFPAFRLSMKRYGVSLRIQSECGKMQEKLRTRITPNTDSF